MSSTVRSVVLAAAGATLALSSLVVYAAPKTNLTLGSTNMTSSHFVVSNAMAQAITAGIPGAHVSHIETGASIDNIRRLAKGELDLGLVQTDAGIDAINGTGPFNGKGVPDLVALYAYDISALNIAVTQDSKITDLAGLDGKKFNPGIRGSASEQLTRQVFTLLGIAPVLIQGTVKDAVEGVQNRQLVGYSKSGQGYGVDATLRELMVSTPMRLLSFTLAQQAKITSSVKGVGFTKIANVMDGQPPVNTLAPLIVYATRSALMDDETAYAIAKSIYDNRAMLIQAWPHLANFDFKAQALAAEKLGLKLHPGAKRFWESLK